MKDENEKTSMKNKVMKKKKCSGELATSTVECIIVAFFLLPNCRHLIKLFLTKKWTLAMTIFKQK